MNFKRALFLAVIFISPFIYCQVGIGTINPDSSSLLDLSSDNKGILIPRMSETQKNDILTPANGLLIYQITTPSGFFYYNGSRWVSLSAADGDNLGNHLATQAFNMGNHNLTNANSIGLAATNSTVFDFNRFDAGSTFDDQLRLSANGVNIFGILGDGKISTRNDVLMVNNATIDNVDISDMVGIVGSDLGFFQGTTIPDGVSIKEALQILENAVESSIGTSSKNEEFLEIKTVTPKFSINIQNNTFSRENIKSIPFDTVEFDNLDGFSIENNAYIIPISGTYFIQFQYALESVENSTGKQAYISIEKNGIEISRTSFVINANHKNTMNTVSVFKTFKKGDRVKPIMNIENLDSILNATATSFSGFMVN